MKILKIIVDKKPKFCCDCRFCCQYYDDMYEEYVYKCVVSGKTIDDTEVKTCDIFKEQSE